jgi:hypothetical protein
MKENGGTLFIHLGTIMRSSHIGNCPQEELAKLGYSSERMVEKILLYFGDLYISCHLSDFFWVQNFVHCCEVFGNFHFKFKFLKK